MGKFIEQSTIFYYSHLCSFFFIRSVLDGGNLNRTYYSNIKFRNHVLNLGESRIESTAAASLQVDIEWAYGAMGGFPATRRALPRVRRRGGRVSTFDVYARRGTYSAASVGLYTPVPRAELDYQNGCYLAVDTPRMILYQHI